MSKLRELLMALLCLMVAIAPVHATTVYYQPTPFPKWRCTSGTSCPGGNMPMPQDLNVVHSWSGWFNNSYNTSLVQDNKLLIGGWGDFYVSLLRFDLTGLPKSVTNATLGLYAIPFGSGGPSQVAMSPITSDWNPSTVGWDNFPSSSGGYGWSVSTAVNQFRGYSITDWYNGWKNGAMPDKGILIWPLNNDGTQRFDQFVSGRSTSDGLRPVLRLDFNPPVGMPSLKFPLPGGAQWLLTNEAGGYECMGKTPWPDPYHQDATGNYFAIDIAPANIKDTQASDGGKTYPDPNNIPVIAAAGGKVLLARHEDANGNYVVIDHDGDGILTTGYQTRYLHLRDFPLVKEGNPVSQGDKLGYMGGTGNYGNGYPVHLHFGVRYKNTGYSYTSELTYVTMEGLLMKSYQTECSVNSSGVPTAWIRYYRSTNSRY